MFDTLFDATINRYPKRKKKRRSRVGSFEGKIPFVKRGGRGMGRELVCQLISEGGTLRLAM